MTDYQKTNLAYWNELADINAKSKMYDLEGFLCAKDKVVLKPIELEELGEVAGKTLLHLQCHFGLDNLSWARKGARVTGADFSDKAIQLAKSISRQIGLEADFICADIYDLPAILTGNFDIVFTSYGVLCWLPDLKRWGETIAGFLKPGGVFYIVEFHPFLNMFENERNTKELVLRYSYFHNAEPMKWESDGAYADRNITTKNYDYEWTHSISEIVNAIAGAGLEIEFLHEFPYCNYDHFPFMEQGLDGWWRVKNAEIPLLFSLRARKKEV